MKSIDQLMNRYGVNVLFTNHESAKEKQKPRCIIFNVKLNAKRKEKDVVCAWMSGSKPSGELLNQMNNILLKWHKNHSINVEIEFMTFGDISLNSLMSQRFEFKYPFNVTQSLLKMMKEQKIECMVSDLSKTHFVAPAYGISDNRSPRQRMSRMSRPTRWSQSLMLCENISVRAVLRSGSAGMEMKVGKIYGDQNS